MKTISGVLFALGILVLSGCEEFVRSDAELSSPKQTSTVDVVGEPGDPTPDSDMEADILGSDRRPTNDSIRVTDGAMLRDKDLSIDESPIEPPETDSEPDVVSGLVPAKPFSLKTKSAEPTSAKQVKP